MKSPLFRELHSQLSDLNNNFSHYLFIWEQFNLDYEEEIKNNEDVLTTEFFDQNSFAPQWQVKLGLLNKNHDETKSFILKSMYLLSFYQFEYYNRNLFELARKLDSSIPDIGKSVKVPNDILEKLNIDLEKEFEKGELLTFDYLRLRRNRIVHSGNNPTHDLKNLIKQNGKSLNDFWENNLINGLYKLDFQDLEINKFKENEVFDLINIYRTLSNKIDAIVLSQIERGALISYLKENFNKAFKSKIRSWNEKRLKSKFQGYCNKEFNMSLEDDENFEKSDVA